MKSYDIIIIGAGIQGLALAYHLAKTGAGRVALFDKGYPGAGASGRNGEMVRSAFASHAWIRLFDESLKLWENLSRELDYNVMFTRCGYLVLASTDAAYRACRSHLRLQKAHGLRTHLLDQQAVLDLIPALNPAMAAGGVLQPDAGFARHDAAVWAYLAAVKRLKVDLYPFTEVTAVDTKGQRVHGIRTQKAQVATPLVVNAAGGHAGRVARMAGVELPTRAYRLEMLVTEPVKPFLRPALSSPHTMSYMHQTTRGEFAGGAETADLGPSRSIKSTLEAARDMAQKFTRLFPTLAGVRLMRQWGGIVNMAPDVSPVIGPVHAIDGFILNCGWVYGFMGAPAAGKHLAEFIVSGRMPETLAPFSPQRFAKGELIRDGSLAVPAG